MDAQNAYRWLVQQSRETAYLGSTAELLGWDQRTYMPAGGHALRSEQLALLARLIHERQIDPRIGEALACIEQSVLVADPEAPFAVNVREWRRDYDRERRIPTPLAEELARAAAAGEMAWQLARPNNDWAGFSPHLDHLIALLREKAAALGHEQQPYDALLDEYEPDERTTELRSLFDQLRQPLIRLLADVAARPATAASDGLHSHFEQGDQQRFVHQLLDVVGYDFNGGRVDVSAHPITIGIGPGDIRLTTRYRNDCLIPAIFGALHEAGHALYEQGLPAEHWGTPLGRAASIGIHESQSRLWENMVGRSHGFWRSMWPRAQRCLPGLQEVPLDRFVRSINDVRPSLIRVEADEVTYNLHILLRFELELALINGQLSVADLPEAWNAKMSELLGLDAPDFAHGVMQDVHWSGALFGYFPTYTLGNVYAAQLFHHARQQLGDLDALFAKGDVATLLQWLRTHVHRLGRTYPPRDLIFRICGEKPDPRYLLTHLARKCEQI